MKHASLGWVAAVSMVAVPFSASAAESPASQPRCELEFKKSKLCASLTWTKGQNPNELPSAKDAAEFQLRFWKKGKPETLVKPAPEVHVKLWMPSMGHGSMPVTTTPNPNETGVYTAKNVLFVMSGDWEIQVRLYQGERIVDQAKIAFNKK